MRNRSTTPGLMAGGGRFITGKDSTPPMQSPSRPPSISLAILVLSLLAVSPSPATEIVGWGDSLTYGTGGDGRSWPWWFYQISGGVDALNKGIGGESSGMIKTRMLAATDLHDEFTVIWAGRNNVGDGSSSTWISYSMADIAAMVAALEPTANYLVLGVINANDEPAGSATLNNINTFNSNLAATYGEHFIDIRPLLVSSYDPSSPQEVGDNANDLVPASLLSDKLHLNAAGYEIVGAAIYDAYTKIAAPERGTWTGSAGANKWKDSGNWSASPFSGDSSGFSSNETATFAAAGAGTIDLEGTVNVKQITFGSRSEGAGAYVIGKSGDALNLSSGGGVAANPLVRANETIGGAGTAIYLSDAGNSTAVFANNGQADLVIAADVAASQAAGNATKLVLAGSGRGAITGNLSGGGTAGNAALAIVKQGSGSWTLAGQNSFSGNVSVLGGELALDYSTNDPLASSVAISNAKTTFRGKSAGTTSESVQSLVMGSQATTANTLALDANGGDGFKLEIGVLGGAKSSVLSNLIDLSGSAGNSIKVGALGEGAYRPLSGGVLMGGLDIGSARAVNIVRDDAGYGFATISSTTNGTIGRLATGIALTASNSSNSANYRLESPGTVTRTANLDFSTLTIDSAAGDIALEMEAYNLSPTGYGRGILISGNHDVTIGGTGLASSLIYNYSTATLSLSLATPSSLLLIGGTGFTNYSGAISANMTSGIVVAQGTVRISREQDLAASAPTRFAVTGGGVLEIGADLNGAADGDFSYAINTGSLAKTIRFFGDSGVSASGGYRVVNFNGASTPTTYTWGSNYFLTNADGTTDGGYTLKLSSAKSDSTVEIVNPILLGAGTSRVVDVADGSAATDAVLSGELSGSGASLTKTGDGTLSLRAKNIYSGATVVEGGRLLVEGSLSYTSAVDVESGAELRVNGSINANSTANIRGTLGGNGSLGTAVIGQGGTISPGNSPGTLTVATLVLEKGSNYLLEVNSDGTGTAGINWDTISAGSLDLAALSVEEPVILMLSSLEADNSAGALETWDPDTDHTWASVISFDSMEGGFDSRFFRVDTTGFANAANGTFRLIQNGSALDLQYTAVPEPKTLALGLVAFAVCCFAASGHNRSLVCSPGTSPAKRR